MRVSRAARCVCKRAKEKKFEFDYLQDDEKSSLFDALDVFAMPSRAESFGIAYLEAWLRSKPVIGARLGSTECIIDHGTDGELVALDDADELATCILRLLGDRERRLRLGSAGYGKTIARFTWDKVTDAVERLYRDSSGWIS